MSNAPDQAIIDRLSRSNGHLARITEMVEENGSALDIAQQLQAVMEPLTKAKAVLNGQHIEHHLEEAVGEIAHDTHKLLFQDLVLARYL